MGGRGRVVVSVVREKVCVSEKGEYTKVLE